MAEGRAGRRDRDRQRRQFLDEAEEILDGLSADLGVLEKQLADAVAGGQAGSPGGAGSQAVINRIFRRVHSLKGLSGLQDDATIPGLAHDLEETLDRLRSGASRLDGARLDLLHRAVDALGVLVRGGGAADIDTLRASLRREQEGDPEAPSIDGIELDDEVRAALSAHEEQRLALAMRPGGGGGFLVRLALEAGSFDRTLRRLIGRLERESEVISTVPSGAVDPQGRLQFILIVAGLPRERLERVVRRQGGVVQALRRRTAERPGADAAPGAESDDLAGVSGSLRVAVERLDDLLAQTGDLSIAAAALERSVHALQHERPDDRHVREVGRQARALMGRLRSLQRSTIGVRLVPLEALFTRLARQVARTARLASKEVDLLTLGADTELDKTLIDQLGSPLLLLLLNGLDHGVESAEERLAAGKPRRARLVLNAFRRAGRVVIEVSDDGRGIHLAAVRRAAESTGRLAADQPMSDADLMNLIFEPGLSTAPRVSQVSGRGVGLDAVRRAIRFLKGSIELRSIEGRGTTFTLDVPISLTLVQALIVHAGGWRFAIPMASIREHLTLQPSLCSSDGARESYQHRGGRVPLMRLSALLPSPAVSAASEAARYAVLTGSPGRGLGIVVDGFLGQREVVIKPIGRRLRDLPGLAGATDLGDATAVLVLDPEDFLRGGAGEHAAA